MKLHQHLFGNGKPLRWNAWAKPRLYIYISIYLYFFWVMWNVRSANEIRKDADMVGPPTSVVPSRTGNPAEAKYCFQEDFSDIAKSGDAVLVLSSVKVLVEHFWVNSKKVGKNPLMNWTSPFTSSHPHISRHVFTVPYLHCASQWVLYDHMKRSKTIFLITHWLRL